MIISFITAAAAIALAALPASAVGDKDCSDFASQKAAQIFFLNHGGPNSDPHGLDAEGDGVACESNPAPYYYGQSLPDGGGSPQPAPEPQVVEVRTSVGLGLNTPKAIQGESVRLTASVKPRGVRTVVFQRKVDRRWKSFARESTNRQGKVVHALRAPGNTVVYRTLVQPKKVGNKKFTAAKSDDRTLRVHAQKVVLTLDDYSVAEGVPVDATAVATPVRVGRLISLQVRRDGRWETIRTGKQDKRGLTRFAMASGTVGEHDYRAVVRRHRGAASEASRSRTLTVLDVTAPAAPVDLAASPGDGTAALTWSAVVADDLSHYEVWMRQDSESTWTMVGNTTATALSVSALANDVTYWFTVVSVDNAGNASEPAAEVSATPLAPTVP